MHLKNFEDGLSTINLPILSGATWAPSAPCSLGAAPHLRISRLTGARHARGHDPAPRVARRLASGGRRTAPVACARSANSHGLRLCNALAMRAAGVRAALSRGANPAHACRYPHSNAGAWRDSSFARMPARNMRQRRRPVQPSVRLQRRQLGSLARRRPAPPRYRAVGDREAWPRVTPRSRTHCRTE